MARRSRDRHIEHSTCNFQRLASLQTCNASADPLTPSRFFIRLPPFVCQKQLGRRMGAGECNPAGAIPPFQMAVARVVEYSLSENLRRPVF